MGKGNRNSQKRIQEQVNNSEKYLERQKKQASKKRSDKVLSAVLIAFAVIVVAALAVNFMVDGGVFMRTQSAMETENVEVNSAMMSFFFNDYLMNWYGQYGSYIEQGYFSINPTVSLKTQQFGGGYEKYFLGEYDGTWYEYFLDQISNEIELYITYAEGAIEAGLTLDDEDKAEIDELIKGIKTSLKAQNAKFSDWYGRGVKEKDIRECYELVYLASNFYEYKTELLGEALDKDDSALYDYVEDNKGTFYSADVLSYKISKNSKNFENDAAFEAAVAEAKAAAEKIANAKTPAEFVEFVENYKAEADTSDVSVETDSDETEATDDLESKIDGYKSTVNYAVPDESETETDAQDQLNNWLFVEEAPENDVKIIEEEGTEVEEIKEEDEKDTDKAETDEGETSEDKQPEKIRIHDTYTVTVYFVYKPVHLDKSLTKDAAFLITDNKEILESFIEKFKNGETNVDNFVELAEKEEEAMHNSHDHEAEGFVEPTFVYNGMEKMADGYFAEDYNALNDWLDSGDLKDNTTSEIIEMTVDKTTYYAVAYFEKYNVEAWYANAYSLTVSEQFEDWHDEKLKECPITVNEKAVMNINTIVMAGASTSHEGHNH